ncbi:MAG: SMI1/KNR4 family protein [Verrucomicrobiales bacterium]|nr:SMI1/KNR4 family protein [Verrucomicrobiales bacterium]
MDDKTYYILVSVGSFAALALSTYYFIWRDQRPEGEYRRGLQDPDYDEVEKYFGAPLPRCLKDFYRSELVFGCYEYETPYTVLRVDAFQPIDMESLGEDPNSGEIFFVLANDGCGNLFGFDPKSESMPVYMYAHDPEEIFMVSETIEEFLANLREES